MRSDARNASHESLHLLWTCQGGSAIEKERHYSSGSEFLNFFSLLFFLPFCQVCMQSCSKAILSRTILNQTTADVTRLCVVWNENKIPTSLRTKAWRHKQPWDVLQYKSLSWKLLLSFLLIFIKMHEAISSFTWLLSRTCSIWVKALIEIIQTFITELTVTKWTGLTGKTYHQTQEYWSILIPQHEWYF